MRAIAGINEARPFRKLPRTLFIASSGGTLAYLAGQLTGVVRWPHYTKANRSTSPYAGVNFGKTCFDAAAVD